MLPPAQTSASLTRAEPGMFSQPWRKAVGLIGILGLGLAIFLLFRSSSNIRTLPVPRWKIFKWIDSHGELRNVPAFALLALPFMTLTRGRKQRRNLTIALMIFTAVTEFGQLAIPTRTFDLRDIANGWLGLALVWGMFELIALFRFEKKG